MVRSLRSCHRADLGGRAARKAAIRIEQNPSGSDGVYMLYDPADPQGGARLESIDTSRLTFSAHDAGQSGETSYYVRVTQADGHQAWSSPIWVTR